MEASAGLVAGSHNRNELVVIRRDGEPGTKPLRHQNGRVCQICGDDVGLTPDGEPFVACNECAFPVCRDCYEYERREGTQNCPQCKTRFKHLKVVLDAAITPWEKSVTRARAALFFIIMAAMLVFLIFSIFTSDTSELIEFSMELTAFEGLNATVGRTVSPAFNLTVHVENSSFLQAWCSNGGEVLVSYSGIALAWGRVPVFCVQRRATAELTVLPWGWEVGLSEDLRRRLVSDWHMGTAQVLVVMRIFDLGNWMHTAAYRGTSLHRFKLMVRDGEGQTN